MGLLKRLLGNSDSHHRAQAQVRVEPPSTAATQPRPHDFLAEGEVVLHVVGESHYESHLTRVRAADPRSPFLQASALLIAEPDNPHDPNAVAVKVSGGTVGYLAREDASLFHQAVLRRTAENEAPPSVRAAVVGGNGTRLGVQLILDPLDFGVARQDLTMVDPRGFGADSPKLRLREARRQLDRARTALDRHFALLQVEDALYRLRDEPGNLAEFEAVCERHHAEMGVIVPALLREFGKLPMLKHYKQMVIAKQKVKDYAAALEWCGRGIAIYEGSAHDDAPLEDLRHRAEKLQAKAT